MNLQLAHVVEFTLMNLEIVSNGVLRFIEMGNGFHRSLDIAVCAIKLLSLPKGRVQSHFIAGFVEREMNEALQLICRYVLVAGPLHAGEFVELALDQR